MFFLYLRRELRRRLRQALFITLGLAVGVGLVITVTAASTGVRNAQRSVLHTLYGVGTDVSVTKTPTAGSGGPEAFGFRTRVGSRKLPAPGTTIDVDTLRSADLATISSSAVSRVAHLAGVAAAAGGLTLTDVKVTGKIPPINSSGGSTFSAGPGPVVNGQFTPSTTSVEGTDLTNGELGPLSAAKLVAGRTFRASDATANVAVLDANYATAQRLTVGSTITVAKTAFRVIGIVKTTGTSGTDIYLPLARAETLSGLTGDVNTIYVAARSAADIPTVSREISHLLPGATVTTSSDLANEVTGSLSSASTLANSLGKWLAIAVLAAAFLLASLLSVAAVSRRIREFGTLKALGWRSRRIIGQVMGEGVAMGVIGGALGIGLGLLGATLVSHLAPPLSATVGQSTGSAAPGGIRTFGAGGFGPPAFARGAASAPTVAVHLSAPVTVAVIALAVVLAVAGGLMAGSLGGWRAARLRPAAALAKVA